MESPLESGGVCVRLLDIVSLMNPEDGTHGALGWENRNVLTWVTYPFGLIDDEHMCIYNRSASGLLFLHHKVQQERIVTLASLDKKSLVITNR